MPLKSIINIVLEQGFMTLADRAKYSMVCYDASHRLISIESL
jgi:thymidylate kinase